MLCRRWGGFPPSSLTPPFVGEVSPLRLRPSHFVGEVSPLRLRPTTLDCTLPWSIHHRTDGMPLGDLPRPPPSAQGPLRCSRSTGNKKKKREHEKEQIISKKRPLLSRRPCLVFFCVQCPRSHLLGPILGPILVFKQIKITINSLFHIQDCGGREDIRSYIASSRRF